MLSHNKPWVTLNVDYKTKGIMYILLAECNRDGRINLPDVDIDSITGGDKKIIKQLKDDAGGVLSRPCCPNCRELEEGIVKASIAVCSRLDMDVVKSLNILIKVGCIKVTNDTLIILNFKKWERFIGRIKSFGELSDRSDSK